MGREATYRDDLILESDLRRSREEAFNHGGDGGKAELDAELEVLLAELSTDHACADDIIVRPETPESNSDNVESSDHVSLSADSEGRPTEATAEAAWHSYGFEMKAMIDDREKSTDILLAELRESTGPWNSKGDAVSYRTVRQRSCAIAIEINRRARTQPQVAPRFRPERRPTHECITLEDRALSCDRQIIDLHWLWCTGHHKIPDSREYVGLFQGEEFDFQLASKFACEKWTFARKAECLGLDAQTEWQLAAIQSRAFQKKWDTIWKGRRGIERRFLDSLAARRASKGHVDEWLQLWTVYRMVGESPERIRQLLPFVSGQPAKDPSGISKRLKRMLQRI